MYRFFCGFLLFASLGVSADPAGVLRMTSNEDLDSVYQRIYAALEADSFWVVFEADMGSRMAGFAEKWGEDYNRRGLEGTKSMVACNIWWTNRIANADPDLLGLCPLHVTLYAKGGQTVVLTPRLSAMAEGSEGKAVAAELEAELTRILESALVAE